MRPLTIKDIAREAGVSHPVVSAVINRRENQRVFVGAETRQRVLEIVRRHGFVPSKAARDLVGRRTHAVGVVLSRLSPYYSTMLEALHARALVLGLQIITFITDGRPDKEEECFNLMRDGRVDGVIAATGEVFPRFAARPYGMKIVTLFPNENGLPAVFADDEAIGRIAADHLIDVGCRKLCCFGAPADLKRFSAFIRRVRDRNLPAPPAVCRPRVSAGFFADGQGLTEAFFRQKHRPDGVFAFNDPVALALMTEALRRGIRIPQDMAVMGCDDTEVCRYTYPSLTSVDINISASARIALDKLTALIEGKRAPSRPATVPVSLVPRESTMKR